MELYNIIGYLVSYGIFGWFWIFSKSENRTHEMIGWAVVAIMFSN